MQAAQASSGLAAALRPAPPARLRKGNLCPRRSLKPSMSEPIYIFHFFHGVSSIFLALCPANNSCMFKQ